MLNILHPNRVRHGSGASKGRKPTVTLVAGLVTALVLLPAESRSQEVSYSVVPTYEELRWNDAFGLERARLMGLRASLDFGPYFSLQPFFARRDDVGLREGVALPPENGIADLYDVRVFGADMQVNFVRGPLVPFARGGGGVLRTNDAEAGRRDRILLRAGGGLRLGLGETAGLEVTAERWATRLGAPMVPGAVDEGDFPDDGVVRSTVFGAGLRLPLGGGVRETEGVPGILPGVFLEPYAGRIHFADALRLDRQDVAGARAGIDLNRNVGLRAFAWRGVEDDFGSWMDLESYGAETQFMLNTGSGVSPFLVAGVGRLSFRDDFRDLDDQPRSREDYLILGGGLALALGDFARLDLGARNLLMSVDEELEDITSPDELVSNWQYSAGLSFSFGARGRTEAERIADRQQEELARLREENLRLRAGEDPRQVDQRVEGTRVDTTGRTVTVPVPEVGEIILRYGEAYAPGVREGDLASLERRIETLLQQQALAAAGDPEQARELLEARLPEIVRQIVREEMGAAQPGVGVPAPAEPARRDAILQDPGLHSLRPFSGLQASAPVQLTLGIRGDLGRITGPIPLNVIPEFSFGIGEGSTTVRAALNGQMGWNLGLGRNLTPYGLVGFGLSNKRVLSLDLGYGASFDAFQGTDRGPFHIFVEHRGVALFSEHQFLVGVSIPN